MEEKKEGLTKSLSGGGFDADKGDQESVVAFTCSEQANGFALERDHAPCLSAQVPNDTSNIQQGLRIGMAVRRLTPLECERLQGFPDGWTEGFSDSTRYKMLGNAVCVNVSEWIAFRLNPAVEGRREPTVEPKKG